MVDYAWNDNGKSRNELCLGQVIFFGFFFARTTQKHPPITRPSLKQPLKHRFLPRGDPLFHLISNTIVEISFVVEFWQWFKIIFEKHFAFDLWRKQQNKPSSTCLRNSRTRSSESWTSENISIYVTQMELFTNRFGSDRQDFRYCWILFAGINFDCGVIWDKLIFSKLSNSSNVRKSCQFILHSMSRYQWNSRWPPHVFHPGSETFCFK